jgi:hypothetical protein
VIPSSRLNPVGVKVVSFMPQPNYGPINPYNNSGNFYAAPVATTRRAFYLGRLDQVISSNTKFYFRYLNTPTQAYRWGGGSSAPEYGPASNAQYTERNNQSYAFNITHLFTPTFFLNFTAGLQRNWLLTANVDDTSVDYPQMLGLGSQLAKQFPTFNIGGGTVPTDNFGANLYRLQTMTNTNHFANFTKIMGLHTLKFGA